MSFLAGAIKAGLVEPEGQDTVFSLAQQAAIDSNDPFAHVLLAILYGDLEDDTAVDGFAVKRPDCEARLVFRCYPESNNKLHPASHTWKWRWMLS